MVGGLQIVALLLLGGGFFGSGQGGGPAGWLQRDPSWVVSSAGTPYKNGGVTYDAAKALDGSTGTYWNPQETSRNYNNWYIELDLKAPYTLSQIAINNYGDTTHDVKAFKLQKSQSGAQNSWEDVTSVSNVQGGTNKRQEFGGFQGTARYWRFVVTQTHLGWQPYLVEVDFYGSLAGHSLVASASSNIIGTGWEHVPGIPLTYVSVGGAGVWGVDKDGQVYYRVGTYRKENAVGTTWQKVDGKGPAKSVSVGRNEVWILYRDGISFRRTGISKENPTGTGWSSTGWKTWSVVDVSSATNKTYAVRSGTDEVWRYRGLWNGRGPGGKTVSVGISGVWGISSHTGKATYYYGSAFKPKTPYSAAFGPVRNSVPDLVQISVGNGIVWVVDKNDEIYYRAGITRDKTMGTKFVKVSGALATLDVSDSSNQVWGVDKQGKVYRRTGIIFETAFMDFAIVSRKWGDEIIWQKASTKRTVEAGETLQDLREVLLDLEEAVKIEQETRELEDMEEDVDMAEYAEKEMRELEEIEENAGMAEDDE